MKEISFANLYIIKCNVISFSGNLGYFTRVAHKLNYVIPLKDSYILDENNVNQTYLIAYEKKYLKLLEEEVRRLNEFYKNSKDGTYHFYVKKLNSGKNRFKLLNSHYYTNFGSICKDLYGYWLSYKLL